MYWWLVLLAAVVLAVPVSAADDKDPNLWLEEVTGEKALEWVKEQNAKATAELTKSPEFKELNDRLLKILDSKERIPYVGKRGDFYYNFWRDEKNKRGLWRRTTLDEYRKPEPEWETVLDLDALGEAEKENWVWHGADVAGAELRALPGLALARRRRRRGRPRVRPEDQDVRQGRLHAARGQERGRLAGPRQRSSSAPTSARAR